MASQTCDGAAQLGTRTIVVTVQAPNPFTHKVRHKIRVVFVHVYQREPLLRDIRKVDLPGNMAIGTPDATIDRIDQRRAPVRLRIPIGGNAVKSFDPCMHEKCFYERWRIGFFALFVTCQKFGHGEGTGQRRFSLGAIFQTWTITDALDILVAGSNKENENTGKNSEFHNYGILAEARFFSLPAGMSDGLRPTFNAEVLSREVLL